jgi:hypothetical protein
MSTTANQLAPFPAPAGTMGERHYSPEQLGELWGLSTDTVRRLFEKSRVCWSLSASAAAPVATAR